LAGDETFDNTAAGNAVLKNLPSHSGTVTPISSEPVETALADVVPADATFQEVVLPSPVVRNDTELIESDARSAAFADTAGLTAVVDVGHALRHAVVFISGAEHS
jgi:hypothetical protein